MKEYTDEHGDQVVEWENSDDIYATTVVFENMYVPGINHPVIFAILTDGRHVMGDHHKPEVGRIVSEDLFNDLVKDYAQETVEWLERWHAIGAMAKVAEALILERGVLELEREETGA